MTAHGSPAQPSRNQFEFSRRVRLDRFTPAERAIYDAIQVVEAAGADVRLTDAVVLLQAARESVADFVDGVEKRRHVSDSEPAEVAWVIERDIASKLHYWTGEAPPRVPWATAHSLARRFSRREDAACMLSWHCDDIGRVVQHAWSSPTPVDEEAVDEEAVPHAFNARTSPGEEDNDGYIWCADCEYHRDHAVHAVPAPVGGQA